MSDRSWRRRALTGLAGFSLAGLLGCNGNVDVNAPGASVRVRASDRGASVSVRTPGASVNVNAFGMQSMGGVGGGSIVTRCPPPPDSFPLPGVIAGPPGNPPLPPMVKAGPIGAPPLKNPPVYGVDKVGTGAGTYPVPAAAGLPGTPPGGFPGSSTLPGAGPGLISASDGTGALPAGPEASPDFGDLVFREPIAPATR